MSHRSSAVSLIDSPLVSRSACHSTSPRRTTGALRVCVIAAVVVMSTALLPGEARAQERRACRATGYFLFTLNEYASGSVVTRTARINILQSDMEVVATSAGQTWSSVTDAKRWACDAAARCYVTLAEGSDSSCGVSVLNTVYETMKRPDHMDAWRRQVACNHARAGSIPGLRYTSTNKVTLVQTKIVATGSRDGITRNADATFIESDHVCWSPSGTAGELPPRDPTRDPQPAAANAEPDRLRSSAAPHRLRSPAEPHRLQPPAVTNRRRPPARPDERAVTDRVDQGDGHAVRAEGEVSDQRADAGAARTRVDRWSCGGGSRARMAISRRNTFGPSTSPKHRWSGVATSIQSRTSAG